MEREGRRRLTGATDAALIVASGDDPAAFRELYDRWAEPLLAHLYRGCFDAAAAADLLAETFAVAYEKRGRFRDDGRPGAAWLYGIARRELLAFHRRRRVELRAVRRLGMSVPALDDESLARIEATADARAQRRALDAALGSLSERERRAVHLRVVAELEYAEVAARLGCSEGAARVRVHRGLARLARMMEVTG